MHFVYVITNIINNKIYIGQTNKPPLRWSQHKSNAKYNRGNQVITRAISKYGANNFTFEVIASCKCQEDVDYSEEQIIIQYDSRNPNKGYNLDSGGNVTPRTLEVSKRISEGLKNHYKDHNGWLKGRKLTEEWKANIAKASLGKPGTNLGKKFDNSWVAKLSRSQTGKELKSRRRFTEEVEKEICRLYLEEEYSMYSLGKQFNCQRTLILNILTRHNIPRRQSNYTHKLNHNNVFSKEQEQEICQLYLAGNTSMTRLSMQYNCGKTTIRSVLLRNNINFKELNHGKKSE